MNYLRAHLVFQPEGAAQVGGVIDVRGVVGVRVVGALAREEVSTSSQEMGGQGSVERG